MNILAHREHSVHAAAAFYRSFYSLPSRRINPNSLGSSLHNIVKGAVMVISVYFKKIIAVTVLLTICAACATVSPEREEIVEWASQIASIEKQLEYEIAYFKPLIERVTSQPPTVEDLDQLTEYNNRITTLYNEISNLHVPQKARAVHALYVENYAKISDTTRYYVLAIKMNDLSYFDKSVLAAQESNRIGDEAYSAFEKLLDYYSISCSEIDFCE